MGADRHRRLPAGPGAGLNAEEAEVAGRLDELAARLEQLGGRRPSYVPGTENLDAGYPFFRFRDGSWTYEVYERGSRLSCRRAATPHELLGWMASDMARDIATAHELEHRVEGQDPRRTWFALWEQLTRALDPGWGEQVRVDIEATLARHPFRD